MNLDIQLNTKYQQTEYKELSDKVESAIDYLWSDDNEGNIWVKRPMNIADSEIEEIIITSIAAQDSCGLFLVIGDEQIISGMRALVKIFENRNKTVPQIEFLGDRADEGELQRVMERLRHYEVSVCVISKDGNNPNVITAYSTINQYMQNRYGQEIASKRIMIITDTANDNLLQELGDKAQSGIFPINRNFKGYYSVLSDETLFVLAVAGYDIKRFMSGCEVMATSSVWDIDGGNLAILRNKFFDDGNFVEIIRSNQNEFLELSKWVSLLFMDNQSRFNFTSAPDDLLHNKMKLVDNNEILNIIIKTKSRESIIKLDEFIKERLQIECINDINKFVDEDLLSSRAVITLENLDEFNLGQVIYFFLMTDAICRILDNKLPY